jgi:hypothetical protein
MYYMPIIDDQYSLYSPGKFSYHIIYDTIMPKFVYHIVDDNIKFNIYLITDDTFLDKIIISYHQ